MIYGGPSMCLSRRQRKHEHREIFSVQLTTPFSLTSPKQPSRSTVVTIRTTSPILEYTRSSSIPSSPTRASPRCSWT
jgi:hypothetical protein